MLESRSPFREVESPKRMQNVGCHTSEYAMTLTLVALVIAKHLSAVLIKLQSYLDLAAAT